MYSSRTEGAAPIQDAVYARESQKDILSLTLILIAFMFLQSFPYLSKVPFLDLFEIWNGQQLLQSGEELTNQSLKCCVEVGAVLYRKHILSDGNIKIAYGIMLDNQKCTFC